MLTKKIYKGLLVAIGIIIASVSLYFLSDIQMNDYLQSNFTQTTPNTTNAFFVSPTSGSIAGTDVIVPLDFDITTNGDWESFTWEFTISDPTPKFDTTTLSSCFTAISPFNSILNINCPSSPNNNKMTLAWTGGPLSTGVHNIGNFKINLNSFGGTGFNLTTTTTIIGTSPGNNITISGNDVVSNSETIQVSLGTSLAAGNATLTCLSGCDVNDPHPGNTLEGTPNPTTADLASVEFIKTDDPLITGTCPNDGTSETKTIGNVPYQYLVVTGDIGCTITFEVTDTLGSANSPQNITSGTVTDAPVINLLPTPIHDYDTVTMTLENSPLNQAINGTWTGTIGTANVTATCYAGTTGQYCDCHVVPVNPPFNDICIFTPPNIIANNITQPKIGQVWTFNSTTPPPNPIPVPAPDPVTFTIVNTPPTINVFDCNPEGTIGDPMDEDTTITCSIQIEDPDTAHTQVTGNLSINTLNKFTITGPNNFSVDSALSGNSQQISNLNMLEQPNTYTLLWTAKNDDVETTITPIKIDFSITDPSGAIVKLEDSTNLLVNPNYISPNPPSEPRTITVNNTNDKPEWSSNMGTGSLISTLATLMATQPININQSTNTQPTFTQTLIIEDDDLNVPINVLGTEDITYDLTVKLGTLTIASLIGCTTTVPCTNNAGLDLTVLNQGAIPNKVSTATIEWAPDNALAIEPNPVYTFTLKAKDTQNGTPGVTTPLKPTKDVIFTVKVNNVNDAPTVDQTGLANASGNGKFTGVEDTPLTIDFSTACNFPPSSTVCGSDIDGDFLQWCIDGFNSGVPYNNVTTIPGIQKIYCTGSKVTITPEPNFAGIVNSPPLPAPQNPITIKLSDGQASVTHNIFIGFSSAADALSIQGLTESAVTTGNLTAPFKEDQVFEIDLSPYAFDSDISAVPYGQINPNTIQGQQQKSDYETKLNWSIVTNTLIDPAYPQPVLPLATNWGKFKLKGKLNQNKTIALVAQLSDNTPGTRTELQSFTVFLNPVDDPVLWSPTMRNDLIPGPIPPNALDTCWHTEAYIGHEFSFIPEDPGIVTQVDEGETLVFTVSNTVINFITNLQGKREWKFTPSPTATVGTFETATFHVKDDPNATDIDDLCAEIEIRPASEFQGGGGGGCTPVLNGDVNADCTVDSGDAIKFKYAFNSFGGLTPATITGSNTVNVYDFNTNGQLDAGDVDKVTFAVFGFGGLQVNGPFPNSLGNPSN